jgi:hypothetical protein
MHRSLAAAFLASLSLAACGPAPETASAPSPATSELASAPALAAVQALDYAQPASWLCRPGADEPCRLSAGITIIAADGSQQKVPPTAPAAAPAVDCFYVYPTISRDPGGNADASPGEEEREVIRQQFAHFSPLCRTFVPVYRQATLTALRKLRAGEQVEVNREMAYADVQAAWRNYLATDNQGRGVVFIGHDQGAGILTRLIAAEIDGKPEQGRLISAILPGADIEVPQDSVVGGSFTSVPLCASGDSIGCVIAWSAFRADAPPPADTLFGRAATTGMKVACVNPAVLDGKAGILSPYLPTRPVLFEEIAAPAPWTTLPDAPPIETPFVVLPDLISARCINREGASYLAITVNADPADPRTDTINGDIVVDNAVRPQWGLHLFDMHLAMGNLQSLVSSQSAAWLEQHAATGPLPTDLQKR